MKRTVCIKNSRCCMLAELREVWLCCRVKTHRAVVEDWG